jgi:hypothetical protein
MVYEHLSGCFILKDPSIGFSEIFQTIAIVAHGDIPRSMALVLGANRLLTMSKHSCGFRIIVIGKMFFQPINHSIVLQLWGPFQEHLSPHQFGVLTPRGYEAIFFGIQDLVDLHLDWAMMQIDIEFFLITFFKLLFLKSYVTLASLWRTLSPLPCCFIVLIIPFISNMGSMWWWSPLLNCL